MAAGAPGIGVLSPLLQSRGKKRPSNVTVRVLGTAQDGGIPHLGCSCANCTRARREPRERRQIASLAIADLEQGKFFIVDTTPDVRTQAESALARFRPAGTRLLDALGGVILTHAHSGHYTGLMFFGFESVSSTKMPTYVSRRMADFLTTNGPWSQLVRLGNIELRTLNPGEPVSLTAGICIETLPVPHRDEYSDTLAIRIVGPRKSLIYVPDIQSWEAWKKPIGGEIGMTDFALLDGTFFAPEELSFRSISAIGHPPIRESVRLLRGLPRSKKAGTFFTHFNHTNLALDPAGEARREIEEAGFGMASEGQEFAL